MTLIRDVNSGDLEAIMRIYNQGIEDNIATLETEMKYLQYLEEWFEQHRGWYKVIDVEVGKIRMVFFKSI